ncbi:FimB/Mfa2 family fimbrial subunit [Dysgonomonas termitidis]|uniref:FimB/Mfa2 family fimbrial subunit n=1 Tax=Dysgonomonas termitidis TaxID=1516126 RepID=A0ABV9KUA1_9BACT
MKTIIYASSHHFVFFLKTCMTLFFLTFIVLAFMLFLQGCTGEDVMRMNQRQDDGESNLSMQTKSLPVELINNSHLYVFDEDRKFVKEQFNVNKAGDKLSTTMPVGEWNLVLFSCDTDISGQLNLPYGGDIDTSPMWETKLIAPANQFLSQTPAELSYAPIFNTEIQQGVTTYKNASLNRNVAKIQVILEEYTGFGNIVAGTNPFAFVELLDAPTTLAWSGKYLPTRDAPYKSDKPIREYFNFNNELKADTVDFIVPAHRGDDAFDATHSDTTHHKLRLRASMPLNNASYYGKTPIVIPFVPKINRIVQVVLKFRGEPDTDLDVKVTVKDWETSIDQDIIFE